MHNAYDRAAASVRESWDDRKKRSFIPLLFCIALTVTGIWFPSWHMYVVYACAVYLGFVAVLFAVILLLLLAVWLLVRWANKSLED